MINLKFHIFSYEYNEEKKPPKCVERKTTETYDENITLEEVLIDLHKKYAINSKNVSNYHITNLNELLWSQYFPKKIVFAINDCYDDCLATKLADLQRQFHISNLEFTVLLNFDGLGKSIGEKEGIHFYFHSNEKDLHHNPHIHCKYSGEEMRIEIETLKILDKPFKKSKVKIVKKFVKEHQVDLLNYWNKAIINGESIKLNIEI